MTRVASGASDRREHCRARVEKEAELVTVLCSSRLDQIGIRTLYDWILDQI